MLALTTFCILTLAAATPPSHDDSLAIADSLAFRVQPVALLAGTGDGRGQVVEPTGIAVDAFGRCYVSDATLHRMTRFERDGRWAGESGTLGSGPGAMRRPGSVGLLGSLGVAVLDQENRRVLSYDLFGRLLGVAIDLAAPSLEEQIGRVDPTALATDRGGAIFVVDPAHERILAFDFSGRYVRSVGGFGSRPGSFRGLSGVAVAAHGQLVTTERVQSRVQRLDASGRPLGTWSLPLERMAKGVWHGELAVAVDDSGRVAVADEAGGRLWVFGSDGERLAELSGLARPRALAFAPDGTLLVTETNPGRVRRFGLVPRRARGD